MKVFDLGYAIKILPLMIKQLKVTLGLSCGAMFFGLIIAIILSFILDKKIKFLDSIVKIYISFFRGVPMIAQLFLVYFGFVQVIPSFSSMTSFQAAIFVFSLSSSAFMAESIRGALASIDKGQMEAALSIGMTYSQAMKRIILPQAIRIAIPSLSNSFINLVKDSSLAFTIGLAEMIAIAQMEATASYRYLEAFVDITLVYWILISILTYLQKILEKKMSTWY